MFPGRVHERDVSPDAHPERVQLIVGQGIPVAIVRKQVYKREAEKGTGSPKGGIHQLCNGSGRLNTWPRADHEEPMRRRPQRCARRVRD